MCQLGLLLSTSVVVGPLLLTAIPAAAVTFVFETEVESIVSTAGIPPASVPVAVGDLIDITVQYDETATGIPITATNAFFPGALGTLDLDLLQIGVILRGQASLGNSISVVENAPGTGPLGESAIIDGIAFAINTIIPGETIGGELLGASPDIVTVTFSAFAPAGGPDPVMIQSLSELPVPPFAADQIDVQIVYLDASSQIERELVLKLMPEPNPLHTTLAALSTILVLVGWRSGRGLLAEPRDGMMRR